ncbi:DUF4870 domain-containing protein [Longispora albida]|uniref:DUF4870 domain-containing protein n=1 Tax=Longispora albida TaxID=203523 RepID=UPI000378912D|nr:DUF4870 domain-containing protein [Longispora albida]
MTQLPPPGYATSDDKTWALIAHFGGAAGALVSCGVFGFVAPLIAFLAKGKESPAIQAHSLAALNFQAPLSAATFVVGVLYYCAGFGGLGMALVSLALSLVGLAVTAVAVVFGVMAGIKANDGLLYKYPFNLGLIK